MNILYILLYIFLSICNSYDMHYSSINLLFFIVIRLLNIDYLIPFSICNTIGITSGWYFAVIYDKSLIDRIIIKNNWNYIIFYIGDIFLHFLPLLYSLLELCSININVTNNNLIRHCGLYSLLINLIYFNMIESSFSANNHYVYQPYFTWNILWSIVIMMHIIPMYILNYRVDNQRIQYNVQYNVQYKIQHKNLHKILSYYN